MRKKVKTSLLLVMSIVMMMLSSAKMWAGNVTITALSGSPSNYANLFDGNNNTTWDGYYFFSHTIFKISESKAIKGYTLVDGATTKDRPGRHWGSWAIYGANFLSDWDANNNADAWMLVDIQYGSKYNSAGKQSFTVSNAKAYRYYKIVVLSVGASTYIDEEEDLEYEENDQQEMAEVQFTWGEASSGSGQVDDNITFTPFSGYPNSVSEGYDRLFDGNKDTKWCGSSDDCHVIFKLSQSKAIKEYKLVDGADTDTYTGRHWKAWKIYGGNFSSDGAAKEYAAGWVEIDSQSGSEYNSSGTQTFTVSNAKAYQYYKIVVTEVGKSQLNNRNEVDMQQMADILFTWDEGSSGGTEQEETIDPLLLGKNTVHIYKSSNATPKYFHTFTPEESGTYTFTFSHDNGIIFVYTQFGEQFTDPYGATYCSSLTTPLLTAGTTYTLYVAGNASEYQSATINITKASSFVTINKENLREALSEINTVCRENNITYTLTFDYSYECSEDCTENDIDGAILHHKDGDNNYVITPINQGTTLMAPEECNNLFSGLSNLTALNLNNFNTSNVSNMYKMFSSCSQLSSLTISNFDMTNVGKASSMFLKSLKLKKITLKSLPYLLDETFNGQFDGDNITVNYDLRLNDNSIVYSGKNNLPTATEWTAYPTYTRSIATKNNWGTVVLPFEAKSDKVVQFYELTGVSSGTLTLSPVATVPANTPCLFKKKVANATSVTITANKYAAANAVPTTSAVGGLTLTGTYTASNVATGAGYVLDDDKFLMTATETKISPFRAYLAGSIDGVDTLTLPDNTTPGDLDDDSNITVVDLTLLIKLLNNSGTISNPAADVNGNGSITIDDVDALRNKVLEVK